MKIRIYNGKGTLRNSLKHTLHTFSNYAPAKYQIGYISAEKIILGEWFDDTALLIIPGGADLHLLVQLYVSITIIRIREQEQLE